jgi:acyl carrier protein
MDNIVCKVSEIAYKIKNDDRLKDKEFFSSSLTGDLRFDPIDMCYLAVEIMTNFRIKLDSQDILDYRFNSINDISACVKRHIG